jgi:hypothetical protein
VSAWASSSYSGVLGPCSGDVIGNAVSYLPTIVGTLRRRVASLVVVIPLLGCVFGRSGVLLGRWATHTRCQRPFTAADHFVVGHASAEAR